jgi:hypothetical protein
VELIEPFPHRCKRRDVPITASRELSVLGSHRTRDLAHIQTYPRIAIELDQVVHTIPTGKVQREQRSHVLGMLPCAHTFPG